MDKKKNNKIPFYQKCHITQNPKELTCKFKFNRHVVYDHHNSISNLIVKINPRMKKKIRKIILLLLCQHE